MLGILRAHVAALGTDKFFYFFNPRKFLYARLGILVICKNLKIF